MEIIKNYLSQKQILFNQHQFFNHLSECQTIHELMEFAPQLAFWVMGFQDILRLNESFIKDPYLYKVARHHRLEDKGHDKWFLEDIEKIFGEKKLDIQWLFHNNQTTRDAAYALISEVYRLNDEHLRVVLLLTLESSGHVFFAQVAKEVDRLGFSDQLKYFSNSHLEVEKAHELFETAMERELFSVKLDPMRQQQGRELIDRAYHAFETMFNGLSISQRTTHVTNAIQRSETLESS